MKLTFVRTKLSTECVCFVLISLNWIVTGFLGFFAKKWKFNFVNGGIISHTSWTLGNGYITISLLTSWLNIKHVPIIENILVVNISLNKTSLYIVICDILFLTRSEMISLVLLFFNLIFILDELRKKDSNTILSDLNSDEVKQTEHLSISSLDDTKYILDSIK